MNIPEKAVEAILRRDPSWPDEYDEGHLPMIRRAARRDLDAAAPFIAAEALRWAADDLDKDHSDPYEAMGRFLARADELDPPRTPTNS